jgi:hypothetical protein
LVEGCHGDQDTESRLTLRNARGSNTTVEGFHVTLHNQLDKLKAKRPKDRCVAQTDKETDNVRDKTFQALYIGLQRRRTAKVLAI